MKVSAKKILVCGPQRSGTTILAKMLAQDLDYTYIDEEDFGVHDIAEWLVAIEESNIVVQCPTMLRYTLNLSDEFLVVMTHRPIEEIEASQDRINWGEDGVEAEKFNADSNSAQAKYAWWEDNKELLNYKEYIYGGEYMRNHPLWIEERENFHSKQTEMVE